MIRVEDNLDGPEDLVRRLVDEGIQDVRLLAAFRSVDRRSFVPPDQATLAYVDGPVPIGHDQVATQPSLVGHMVQALRLDGSERVLEIGTGLGFQTAILAMLCREVYSVEWFPDLADQARRNLEATAIRNAFVVCGDGTLGLSEHAPYDAVITCAAAARVPVSLVEQLAEGGRLVHPLGRGHGEEVLAYTKRGGALVVDRRIVYAYFVPMIERPQRSCASRARGAAACSTPRRRP